MYHKSGFTLVELLVALVLLGVLIAIAGGFVLPLTLTRDSGVQSRAVAESQSYLELLKNKWLNPRDFTARNLPKVCQQSSTDTDCDMKIENGWKLEVESTTKSAWKADDVFRIVVVEITPTNTSKILFRTVVSKP